MTGDGEDGKCDRMGSEKPSYPKMMYLRDSDSLTVSKFVRRRVVVMLSGRLLSTVFVVWERGSSANAGFRKRWLLASACYESILTDGNLVPKGTRYWLQWSPPRPSSPISTCATVWHGISRRATHNHVLSFGIVGFRMSEHGCRSSRLARRLLGKVSCSVRTNA